MKRSVLFVCGLLLASSILAVDVRWSPVLAKDTMEVRKEKDKTVYTIDSDDEGIREEERDKERAWQMLQNGNIWIDGRQRRPAPNSADR